MPVTERVHFKIALPLDLKKDLEHAAVDNRRSLSAEIIARLEASLTTEQRSADFQALVDAVRESIRKNS